MSDFETHERGTAEELKLLRALANTVGDALGREPLDSNNFEISVAYGTLLAFYEKQMESERFQNGI